MDTGKASEKSAVTRTCCLEDGTYTLKPYISSEYIYVVNGEIDSIWASYVLKTFVSAVASC